MSITGHEERCVLTKGVLLAAMVDVSYQVTVRAELMVRAAEGHGEPVNLILRRRHRIVDNLLSVEHAKGEPLHPGEVCALDL